MEEKYVFQLAVSEEQKKYAYQLVTRVRDKKRLVKVDNLIKNSYLYR